MKLTNQSGNAVTTRGGEYFFVQRSPPSGQFDRHSGCQQRPAGSSNPCPFEEQGEPHQSNSSRSANNNEHAGCDGVDHLGAKPRDDLRRSAQNDGENDDEAIHAFPVSREELPSPQFHAVFLDDIPEQDSAQNHDPMLPALHQLPSISSLGVQESDLDPPPPLAPKLGESTIVVLNVIVEVFRLVADFLRQPRIIFLLRFHCHPPWATPSRVTWAEELGAVARGGRPAKGTITFLKALSLTVRLFRLPRPGITVGRLPPLDCCRSFLPSMSGRAGQNRYPRRGTPHLPEPLPHPWRS